MKILTVRKSEAAEDPLLSESEFLGDKPSSDPSGTGDGGWGADRWSTFNLQSSTAFPDSLLNWR